MKNLSLNSILFLTLMVSVNNMTAQQEGVDIPLYPDGIPNSKDVVTEETIRMEDNGQRFIKDTADPTLTMFAPTNPNGQAVVICPGGGYSGTAIDKEGILVAQSLNEVGVTAFVLKYRTPSDETCVDKSLAPLQDAQQAIRIVRSQAAKFKIDGQKIGIMGFSAGGHLAATTATLFDFKADKINNSSTSVRPDFVVLIYPVISFNEPLVHEGSRFKLLGENPTQAQKDQFSPELQITEKSPPAFLVHAADDYGVKIGNSIAYYEACLNANVLAEMHLYPKGGHGFGMNNTTTPDAWMDRLKNWLTTL